MPDVYKKYTNGLGKGRRYTKQYKKVNIDVRKQKNSHERRFLYKAYLIILLHTFGLLQVSGYSKCSSFMHSLLLELL